MEGWIILLIFLGLVVGLLGALFSTDRRMEPVSQWTKEGNFIRNFRSIKEAPISTGTSYNGIGKCCRGLQKTSRGYKWKYGNFKVKGGN